MKRTARIKIRQVPTRATATQVLVMDEALLMSSSREYQGLLERCAQQIYRPNAASMATQAVMYFNSGKRVRFLFQYRRADGSPIKPPPQKFIPAQVLRRLSQDALHLESEAVRAVEDKFLKILA